MRLLPFCFFVFAVASLHAQSNRILTGGKMAAAPTIDGTIGDAEWAGAAVAEGFVLPSNGELAALQTVSLAGYDGEAMYFAFKATDPNPELIRATEYRWQGNVEGDDRVIIIINPLGTFGRGDFSQFDINARGAGRASFAGGRAAKREWQGLWQAKARTTATGYEVEVRIPFRLLRFSKSGVSDLNINFARVIPRLQQISEWSNMGSDTKVSLCGTWKGVEVPVGEENTAIEVLPYQILGYGDDGGLVFDTGVDLRHQFDAGITGVGTFNPDFKNVENAVLGIEFSRFERLRREQRPFFVEGSSFFQMGGMSGQMFAPQRIGQIDFGGKVFGSINDQESLGAMLTTRYQTETAAALRYRRLFGPTASLTLGYVGYDREGVHNGVLDLEGSFLGPRWGAQTILARSNDSLEGQGARTDFDVIYRDGTLQGSFGYQAIGSGFLPRAGFAPRKGFRGVNGFLYYKRDRPSGPISAVEATAYHANSVRDDGPGVYLITNSLDTQITFRNALEVGFGYGGTNFQGSKDNIFGLSASYPANDPHRTAALEAQFGKVGGEKYLSTLLAGTYRLPSRLSLSAGLQFVELGAGSEYQHIFSMNYELSEFRSISGRAILADGNVNWYLAFRQSGNLGNEYYLIIGDPNADTFQHKALLKVVIPFTLKL